MPKLTDSDYPFGIFKLFLNHQYIELSKEKGQNGQQLVSDNTTQKSKDRKTQTH